MPYKFIGRATNGYGKTLWEIVGNLKDFGVGRVFARNLFERYPEKSWFRILEVQPLEAPKDVPLYAFDKSRLVSVKCEKYWRGKKLPEPIYITGASYKSDYKLIPKAEEAEYCKLIDSPEKGESLPETVDFPPLFREILQREKGTAPKLPLQYKRTEYNRMADPKGHTSTPSDTANFELGKPIASRLYESVLE